MSLDRLHIAATEDTPEVNLSWLNAHSRIAGRSLPENAYDFYAPIMKWVKSNHDHLNTPVELELQFDYFNSSSGRFLFEILNELARNPKKSYLTIKWTVEQDDELMIEKGEELASLLDLQFEMNIIK